MSLKKDNENNLFLYTEKICLGLLQFSPEKYYIGFWKREENSQHSFKFIAALPFPFLFYFPGNKINALAIEKADAKDENIMASSVLKCTDDDTEIEAHLKINLFDVETVSFNFSTLVREAGNFKGIQQALSILLFDYRWEEVDFFLPGFWYKKNSFTAKTFPSENSSREWFVREDRITYPGVGLFISGEKLSFSIFREKPASLDNLPPRKVSSWKGISGDLIYDEDKGLTDISSLGFSQRGEGVEIGSYYPFSEGKFSYQKKSGMGMGLLNPAVSGLLTNKAGRKMEHNWLVRIRDDESFQEFLSSHWNFAHEIYRPEVNEQKIGILKESALKREENFETRVKGSVKKYFDGYYKENKIAGFLYVVFTESGRVFLPLIEPGFTGHVLLNAKHLLDWGRENNDEKSIERGIKIFDSWCSQGTKNDFFYDLWWSGKIINRPFSDKIPFFLVNSISTRREFESLFALEIAFEDEKKRGFEHNLWKEIIISHLKKLMDLQNEDGSFSRLFYFSGKPKDRSTGATPAAIGVFCKAYQVFGSREYLDSARKAGMFTRDNIINKLDYHGSTIDANCEDKEAVLYALFGMRCLCEIEDNHNWLEGAIKAGEVALTWFYLTDIPFPKETTLGKLGLKTAGFGTVSSENNHIDVYLFHTPATFWWLGERTGRDEFRAMARLLLLNCLQVLPCPENNLEIINEGLIPEILQQTWWDYSSAQGRWYGEFGERAALWTTASIWRALDDFLDTSKINLEELLEMKFNFPLKIAHTEQEKSDLDIEDVKNYGKYLWEKNKYFQKSYFEEERKWSYARSEYSRRIYSYLHQWSMVMAIRFLYLIFSRKR